MSNILIFAWLCLAFFSAEMELEYTFGRPSVDEQGEVIYPHRIIISTMGIFWCIFSKDKCISIRWERQPSLKSKKKIPKKDKYIPRPPSSEGT